MAARAWAGIDPIGHPLYQTLERFLRDVGKRCQRYHIDPTCHVEFRVFPPESHHTIIIQIGEQSVRHADLEFARQARGVRLTTQQYQNGEHRQPMAVEESSLTKPKRSGQIGIMARLELNVDQVGRLPADFDHFIRGGCQGGHVESITLAGPGGRTLMDRAGRRRNGPGRRRYRPRPAPSSRRRSG